MTLQGIDISSWQATTPDLTNLDFVFVRATDGNWDDPDYAMHAADILRAGKVVLGAYEFGVNGLTGAQQAALFLARIGTTTKLVALDVEGGTQPTPQQAADWIAACKAAGNTAGIYHSLSGFPNVGEDFRWVAYWSRTMPTIAWDFWQFTGGPLDHDAYAGTLAQLYELAKVPLPDTSTGAAMGLSVRLAATANASAPWTAFGTAKVNGAGHAIIRVADRVYAAVAAGLDLGVVQKAALTVPLDKAAGDRTNGYVFNDNGQSYFVLGSDVTFTPLPDPTPYSQADLTSASAKALISGFNAGRQAVLTAGASVPVKQ